MVKALVHHGIAIFIDFENLVTRTGITAETFDIQPALDKLTEKGRVVFQRAYCDWERFPAAKKALHEKGVELIDVPPSTRSGKNGADIRLVIDALELAYLREHVDTFVIMSGDSDFCPLAYKLRENNRSVIGMAVRDSTSPLFVKACDEFIYLGPRAAPRAPAVEPTTQGPPIAPPASNGRRRGGAAVEKPPAVVPVVAREVVASLLSKATGPVNPSAIKSAIVRRAPDFDARVHGFSTFGRMIEALEKEGLLKRQKSVGGQWNVVPAG